MESWHKGAPDGMKSWHEVMAWSHGMESWHKGAPDGMKPGARNMHSSAGVTSVPLH
jgi:hypothetical protein